jgi:ketosteroid isomerase-like protein
MTTPTATLVHPNVEIVRNLYAAYARGDVDAAVADLAEGVDWAAEASSDSVPWYGRYRGKSQVPAFFTAITANVNVTEFDVVTIASNDADVIAVVHWTFTVTATGKTASMYMQHWFRFAAGKIVFFRGSEDSEQSARAFG